MSQKPTKAHINSVRSWNRRLVLEKIREAESISRYDISKITGLNPTTVSKLTQDLIDAGYVREIGKGESSGGRKPRMLEISAKDHHFFVHLLHEDSFVFSILDFNFKRVRTTTIPFDAPLCKKDYEALLRKQIRQFKGYNFLGVAIGVVGTANPNTHAIQHTPGIDDLAAPGTILSEELCSNVMTQNLSKVQAWYESSRMPEFQDIAYAILDHGVGLALVMEREIHNGRQGLSGEIGHTWVAENDFACILGHKGCLESHVSIPGILHDLKKLLGREVQLSEFDELALSEPNVRKLFDKKIEMIGQALAMNLDAIEPQALVLAGELVWQSTFFYEELSKYLRMASFAVKEGAVSEINLGRNTTVGQKEAHLSIMLYRELLDGIDLMKPTDSSEELAIHTAS